MERHSAKTGKCGSCDSTDGLSESKSPSKAKTVSGLHPDHSSSKKRLNRIKGQLDAISRMIDDREYCPSILQQVRAASSALRGLEAEILRGHIRGCVKSAFESKNSFEVHDKIEEVIELLRR